MKLKAGERAHVFQSSEGEGEGHNLRNSWLGVQEPIVKKRLAHAFRLPSPQPYALKFAGRLQAGVAINREMRDMTGDTPASRALCYGWGVALDQIPNINAVIIAIAHCKMFVITRLLLQILPLFKRAGRCFMGAYYLTLLIVTIRCAGVKNTICDVCHDFISLCCDLLDQNLSPRFAKAHTPVATIRAFLQQIKLLLIYNPSFKIFIKFSARIFDIGVASVRVFYKVICHCLSLSPDFPRGAGCQRLADKLNYTALRGKSQELFLNYFDFLYVVGNIFISPGNC